MSDSKPFRALLIDPVAQTITEVTKQGDYRAIQKLIGDRPIQAINLDKKDVLYVDEEGLLRPDARYFFNLKGYHQPLAGKGLVLGITRSGDDTDTSLTIEKLAPLITYSKHKVLGFDEGSERTKDGFVYWQRPIFGEPD